MRGGCVRAADVSASCFIHPHVMPAHEFCSDAIIFARFQITVDLSESTCTAKIFFKNDDNAIVSCGIFRISRYKRFISLINKRIAI